MKNIIVPFRYGKGKTGNAMTGEQRAIICETTHYPNAFAQFKQAIKQAVKQFNNPEEAEKKVIKWLTTEGTANTESHVFENEVGEYNFIFFNVHKLQSGEFRGLQSFKIGEETIFVG